LLFYFSILLCLVTARQHELKCRLIDWLTHNNHWPWDMYKQRVHTLQSLYNHHCGQRQPGTLQYSLPKSLCNHCTPPTRRRWV